MWGKGDFGCVCARVCEEEEEEGGGIKTKHRGNCYVALQAELGRGAHASTSPP